MLNTEREKMLKPTTGNEYLIEIWNDNEVKLTNFATSTNPTLNTSFRIVINEHQGRSDAREALVNALGKHVHFSGNHVLLNYVLLNIYKIQISFKQLWN